ncbi:hypothetical protein OB905_10435 [Halobacteria archaeon AArc-dxtr1]|nr:hypothetical protein [Halobacteria archaeon AArc-dxtr1]
MSTQLEQAAPEAEATWSGTVPTAFDARIVGLVVAAAALAASLNVPYGGIPMAAAAFGVLTVVGVAGHALGQRRLRRLTDELAARWSARGGTIEAVTRSSDGLRTEWTLHTPDGPVTVGGIALAPVSQLSIEWNGIRDSTPVGDAEKNIEGLAESLYREIFELS